MDTTKIHGLPNPPLGYELLRKGHAWECGNLRRYEPGHGWVFAVQTMEPGDWLYAVPLDDGYEYFEAGTTVIQAGDETFVRPGDWYEMSEALVGQSNGHCLRRPKAKAPLLTVDEAWAEWKQGRGLYTVIYDAFRDGFTMGQQSTK
jgi:hypothetical protein